VLALFDEHPGTQDFCRFVEAAGVTILGVIPSLVAAWRSRDVLAQVDWSRIRLFTSTGECSHTGDMFYLTARSGYKPIIEYCGGTELAGGYAAGTVLQSARLGCFTTGVFGLRLHIRDEDGAPATRGEVFIEPPAIGLSTRLLNAENHEVYYEGTPRVDGVPLRRHGDEVEQLPSGDLRVHGRCDDTMNLGGIKVSSVEIERVLNLHPSIRETAAVAVPRDSGGPDELAVFAVLGNQSPPAAQLRDELQQYLREHLNPLFKISVLRIVSELPRTASNKILRRQLRKIAIDP
jgi:acetyl-CoA synthetase